ncbi:hypothetical protein SRRS_23420 [Sporomusa rhizae]|uniref:MotE family protein n=1 Tax=Sporomusa rhizae TaxID=357999 RepID=UPI00352A957C
MAEKPKTSTANSKRSPVVPPPVPEVPKSKFGLAFKVIAIGLILCILVAIGFAAGIYLKLINVEKIANDMNLSQNPVVGRFMPKTNFEPVELEEDGSTVPELPLTQQMPAQQSPIQQQQLMSMPQSDTPTVITKEDLEKQAKLQQQQEAKRVSKLARLYGGMKPEAAVSIMKELDDPTIIAIFGKMEEEQVSKILSMFESKRAARITSDMLKGRVQQPSL